MSHGFAGKVLWVDLSTMRVSTSPTKDVAKSALGGRSINTWILLTRLPTGTRPLDPENILALGAGPLVNTTCPGASRLSLDAKSPATGGIGSSNVGGYFAAELKKAGFDHVVVTGRAEEPCYIRIRNSGVTIEPAGDLWGMTTWDTAKRIRESRDCSYEVLAIGPAGENCVRGATVVTRNGRVAGRCGLGAVFGSKNLKAVAVHGSGATEVAHGAEFWGLAVKARRQLANSPGAQEVMRYGTYSHPHAQNSRGFMPVRYFTDEHWDDEKVERVHPEVFRTRFEQGRLSCVSCPLYCSHIYRIDPGPLQGLTCEGFKANTQKNFGSQLDIDEPEALIRLHGLCNSMGLDEDFAACAIGWSIASSEHGLLRRSQAGGHCLRWGDPLLVASLVEEISKRKGLGGMLADGTERAASALGIADDRLAVRIKGAESMESMRAAKGWALGCSVSPRGGTHTRGANLVEFLDVPPSLAKSIWGVEKVMDGTSYEGKAPLVVYYERLHAVLDSLGVCHYVSNWIAPDMLGPSEFAAMFGAAVGREVDSHELLIEGERAHLLEKLFNIKHAGWIREDDAPPVRFMEETIQTGPRKGECIDQHSFQEMLDEYYDLHRWDRSSGWPSKQALVDAGLAQFLHIVDAGARRNLMRRKEVADSTRRYS